MSTASPSALDEFLARYTEQVGAGFPLLSGDVRGVFAALIVISLGLSGLLWAIDENDNIPASLIRKLLLYGFFAWLIASWHDLTLTVVNGFAALGLKAGGGALSVGDLMHSPSKVVIDGLKVAFELLKYTGRIASEGMGVGFFTHFDAILVTGLAAIGIIAAFVALGVHLAVTIIEFYIVTLIGFVTVPFGILSQTAFLSERAIGYVAAIGVKVMAMAIVISIGETLFASYTVSAEPAWGESCGLLIAALVLCMLGFRIPAIAAAQITGGPQLSAGSAASAAIGLAATVGGAALAGRWAMGAAGASLGSGAKAAAARGAAGLSPRRPGGGGPSAGPSGGSGGGAVKAPGGAAASSSRPTSADVAAKARASYTPQPAAEEPAPAAAARPARGTSARPWREDDQGQPIGMPEIHPPRDES